MSSVKSFYNIIKENYDDQEFEPDSYTIKECITYHPIIKTLNLIGVEVKKRCILVKESNDSIFFVEINIVLEAKNKIPKIFTFCYIPLFKFSEKYYVLIKDNEVFFNNNLVDFVFDIFNYGVTYTIAKLTSNNPTIIDIIVNRLMICMKNQNQEVVKIVANMLANSALFVNDLFGEGVEEIIKSHACYKYIIRNNTLMKQIIGNDKLIYGVDYELTSDEVCQTLLKIEPIYIFAQKKHYPSLRTNAYETTVDFVTTESVADMTFPEELPGNEWVKFFDNIHVVEPSDEFLIGNEQHSKKINYIDLPKTAKKYYMFRKRMTKPPKAAKIPKKVNNGEYEFLTYAASDWVKKSNDLKFSFSGNNYFSNVSNAFKNCYTKTTKEPEETILPELKELKELEKNIQLNNSDILELKELKESIEQVEVSSYASTEDLVELVKTEEGKKSIELAEAAESLELTKPADLVTAEKLNKPESNGYFSYLYNFWQYITQEDE